jgi:hypothetical protein
MTISGIDKVETTQSGAICVCHVRGRSTAETREQIAGVLAQRGWPLRELRQEGASLEEFFVRITDPGAVAA